MTLHSSEIPAPPGAYSNGRRIGSFVQVSGQVSAELEGVGIVDQTLQALERVAAVLSEAGLGWADVLMMRVYLAQDDDWDGMDSAYRRVVPQPYPPRTTVSVGLAPGMLVEIDALAVIP